jgi:hypothetical protein
MSCSRHCEPTAGFSNFQYGLPEPNPAAIAQMSENDFVAALVAMTAVFFSNWHMQKKSRAPKSPA